MNDLEQFKNKNIDKELKKSYIEACKNYLFQTEIYKEIFMKGDLTLIIKISESIKSFGPKVKPEIYFILFKKYKTSSKNIWFKKCSCKKRW